MGALPLGPIDVAVAAGLVVLAGAISVALGLRLEYRLGLASVRTVVQLLLVGYILRWVFAIDHPLPLLAVVAVMLFAASRAAVNRPDRTFRGATMQAFVTMTISATFTVLVVTQIVIGVSPWYDPQYVVPLLGMILGNALNGISLCLDVLLERLSDKRNAIEMELALGASRWEAARDHVADSVRRGMIPIINSMMVVGIVSLPGMMTGQILEGADPLNAVKYQIVVMFMIAAATSMGCILIAMLVYRLMFNRAHQLREGLVWKRTAR